MFKYLLWLIMAVPSCAFAARTNVATDIGLMGVSISAVTVVNADARTVWETITDYDHLANFVPGMTLSRVVSPPNARAKVIEQKGEGGMLSLVLPDHVILQLDERPYGHIGFRSVSGWVMSMQGDWDIKGDAAPVTLRYRAHVVPALPPPPMLTDEYVQQEIRLRMDAVGREAERRMQAAGKPL